jgi:branched-chain amino acid transport system substrate-binding protein
VVGALLPLSNPTTMAHAFSMQAALNIAAEEINAGSSLLGKPLRVITYDTAGRPEQAVLFAQRLITQDCAVLLLGGYHDAVALALREVAAQARIPLIVMHATADEITGDFPAETFRVAPAASQVARAPARWLAEVGDYNGDGSRAAVIVVEDSAAGEAEVQRLAPWFAAYTIELEALRVGLPAADFSSTVARIVALDRLPDAIFIRLAGKPGLDLQRQLADAGIGPANGTLIVATRAALDDALFWQKVPDGVGTVVFMPGPWVSTVTPLGVEFAEHYRLYFNRWPESTAFEAHDALWLAAHSVANAGSLATEDLLTALERTDVDLAAGHYAFPYNAQSPPDGQQAPAYLWHQWPDFPLLFLQYTEANQPSAAMPVVWPPTYQTVPGPIVQP